MSDNSYKQLADDIIKYIEQLEDALERLPWFGFNEEKQVIQQKLNVMRAIQSYIFMEQDKNGIILDKNSLQKILEENPKHSVNPSNKNKISTATNLVERALAMGPTTAITSAGTKRNDAFSDHAHEIIETMMKFPVHVMPQDEDNDESNRIRYFAIASAPEITTFSSSTKFVVSSNRIARNDITYNIDTVFPSYYLPSKREGVEALTLENESDVLVTDALDGCTFLAVKTSEGKTKVFHFNASTEGVCDQDKINEMIDKTLTAYEKNHIIFMITHEDYKTSDTPVPLIAMRNNQNNWSFHFQTAKRIPELTTFDMDFLYQNTLSKTDKQKIIERQSSKSSDDKSLKNQKKW